MQYFKILARNDSTDFVLFRLDRKSGRLVFHGQFADLACVSCGKLCEYTALRRGIPPQFRLKCNADFAITGDHIYCVSLKFRKIITDHGIKGLDFLPIPKQPGRFIVIPTVIAPTDMKISREAGMKFNTKFPESEPLRSILLELHGPNYFRQCPLCGRYRETALWPPLEAIQIPSDPLIFFEPSIKLEGWGVKMTNLMCSEAVVDILKRSQITGAEYFEM